MSIKRAKIEDLKSTVEGLCRMARLLGYKDPCYQLMNNDGSCVGDLLYFFEDNQGAVEAVFEWVLSEGRDSNCEPFEDDDEEEDEEDDDE